MDLAARRKVSFRILPFIFLAMVVAFLDRTNVGFAALTMNKELGMTAEALGLGAGLFYVGYLILEIPGGLLAERWSATKWIARIMFSWGAVTVLTGFIQSEWQFYLARFLLGLAEAGFIPAVVVFLGHWFPSEVRAKALSFFYMGIPFATVVGGPLASLLLEHHFLQLSGWRWLFIVEGILAIVAGWLVLLFLRDHPEEVGWLTQQEKAMLRAQLSAEQKRFGEVHSVRWSRVFTDSIPIRIGLAMFFLTPCYLGLSYFLPLIFKEISSVSNTAIGWLLAIPYFVAMICMYGVSLNSDRTGERRWHTVSLWLLGVVGLMLLNFTSHSSTWILMVWVTIAVVGFNSFYGAFWSLPQTYFTGLSAAAALGFINIMGNMGGFFGPYLTGYIRESTGNYTLAISLWVISGLVSAALILSLPKQRNVQVVVGGKQKIEG